MADRVVLHDYWCSSASYRVRIALNLAGIDHVLRPVDLLKGEHRTRQYLKINPQGLVPALEIDGHALTQSLAIIEYLCTTRALPLLPETALQRARVQAAAMAIAMDIHPVCNLSVVTHATGGREPERTQWMQHFIAPGLAAFERLISPHAGAFCFGDEPSLADVCLVPQLYNAQRWGVDYSACKTICHVQKICESHPAFAAAHPDKVRPAK